MKSWRVFLVRLFFCLWVVQLLWLTWHFAPEAADLGKRLGLRTWGQAIRLEDPFYQWVARVKETVPPHAAYVFLDRYEAGKEIEARYHLYPRRHVLLRPQVPPGFLYFELRRHRASYLLIRDPEQPVNPDTRAALLPPAFVPVKLPGPGLVFRVDYRLISGDFYD